MKNENRAQQGVEKDSTSSVAQQIQEQQLQVRSYDEILHSEYDSLNQIQVSLNQPNIDITQPYNELLEIIGRIQGILNFSTTSQDPEAPN